MNNCLALNIQHIGLWKRTFRHGLPSFQSDPVTTKIGGAGQTGQKKLMIFNPVVRNLVLPVVAES